MKNEQLTVPKKEYLKFQIDKNMNDIENIDAEIRNLQRKKNKLKEDIKAIKEANRDIFPQRGPKPRKNTAS